jgi:hypothetical protein
MKLLTYLLLITMTAFTLGCADSAEKTQQALEIDALNQAIQNATANSTTIEQVVAQL